MAEFGQVTSDIGRIASITSSDVTFNVVLERDAKKGEVIPFRFRNLHVDCAGAPSLREEIAQLQRQREHEEARIHELEDEWEKKREMKEKELKNLLDAQLKNQRQEWVSERETMETEWKTELEEKISQEWEKERETKETKWKTELEERIAQEWEKKRATKEIEWKTELEEDIAREWEKERETKEMKWEAEWKERKKEDEKEWEDKFLQMRDKAIEEARKAGEKECNEWEIKMSALREEEESERKRLSEEHEQDLTEKAKMRKAEEDKQRLRDDQEWKKQREQEQQCIEEKRVKEEQQWKERMNKMAEDERKDRDKKEQEFEKEMEMKREKENKKRSSALAEWRIQQEKWEKNKLTRVKEEEDRLMRLYQTQQDIEKANKALNEKIKESEAFDEKMEVLKRQLKEMEERLKNRKDVMASPPSPLTQETDGGQIQLDTDLHSGGRSTDEEVEQGGSTPKGNSDKKSVMTLKDKNGGSTLNRSSNKRKDGNTLKGSSDGTPTLQPMSKSRKNKGATFRPLSDESEDELLPTRKRKDGSTLKGSSDGTPTSSQPMSKSRKNKGATFSPLSDDSEEELLHTRKRSARQTSQEGEGSVKKAKSLSLCMPRLRKRDQQCLIDIYGGPSSSSAGNQGEVVVVQTYKRGRGGTYAPEEVESIQKYFAEFIRKGERPPTWMCEEYLEDDDPNPDKGRTPKDIQDKVWHLRQK